MKEKLWEKGKTECYKECSVNKLAQTLNMSVHFS
jgi:hypothetical protein